MNFTQEQNIAIESALTKNTYIGSTAGSGKSSVLGRIGKILSSNQNNNILLITFTNKSAKDIINKAGRQSNILGGTFHSIAYKLMRSVGIETTICDENKKRMIIRKIFNCKKDKERFKEIYDIISTAKSVYPEDQCHETELYNKELDKYDMMDFDDIINNCIDYVKNENNIIEEKITHILVDELQDTSRAQLELLKVFVKRFKSNITGVADYDQSIYEFRSANPENVHKFIKIFKCNITPLGLNFRSVNNIVRKARNLIEHNSNRIKIDIRANNPKDGIINTYQCSDPNYEIDYIVNLCKRKKNTEIAILYRTRLNKMQLEFQLRRNRIKYIVNDSTEIIDRSAFRVILCMMKIASGRYDVYDLQEASKGMKGLGHTSVDKIRDLRENGLPELNTGENYDLFDEEPPLGDFSEFIKYLRIKDKKIKRRTNTITIIQSIFEELFNEGKKLGELVKELQDHLIGSFDVPAQILDFLIDICNEYKCTKKDIAQLCNEFGLDTKQENNDEDAMVTLSTIHSSKGGEYQMVIMPFCDWKIKPDPKIKNIWEAERRLFYVGITRAKTELYITYSGNKKPLYIREMKI